MGNASETMNNMADQARRASAPDEHHLYSDRANDVKYRLLDANRVQEGVDSVAQILYDTDPAVSACGGTLQDWTELTKLYIGHMAEQKCSIVARDVSTGKVLGILLCEDYATEDPEGLADFIEKSEGDWKPVFEIRTKLRSKFNEKFEIKAEASEREKGASLCIWALAVSADARGRNIEKKFVQLLADVARINKFKRVFATTPDSYTTVALLKAGMVKLDFVDYTTSENENIQKLPEQSGRHAGMTLSVNDIRK